MIHCIQAELAAEWQTVTMRLTSLLVMIVVRYCLPHDVFNKLVVNTEHQGVSMENVFK